MKTITELFREIDADAERPSRLSPAERAELRDLWNTPRLSPAGRARMRELEAMIR